MRLRRLMGMAYREGPVEYGRLLVRLGAVLSVLAGVWFAYGMVERPPSAKIAWFFLPPVAFLGAAQAWMTGRAAGVHVEARRFWRIFGVGIGLIGGASVALSYETWPDDGVLVGPPGPIAMSFFGAAILTFLWGLVRLPLGVQTIQQRLTLWYDLGTVMLAVAIFVWHFATRDLVARGLSALPQTAASLAAIIVGFVVVFTLAKATLTGSRTLDPGSLRLLAFGAVGGCAGSALESLTVVADHLNVCHYTVPIATSFANWSAYAQRHPGTVSRPSGPRRERPFSLLPYVAVAATDMLLLSTVMGSDDDGPVVASGAVALTALVVLRQLTSFWENARLLNRIARHERRFRSLVQNSSDIVSIITAEGTIKYLSPSVHRVLGTEADSWVGRSVWDAMHPDDREAARTAVESIVSVPAGTVTYQARLAHRDRSWRWVEVISSNLLDDASINGIVSNARDITDEREFQHRLHHEATHDPMTGLANRVLFSERLSTALADGDGVIVALIDLDGFKAINDSLGHAAGDVVLTAVADRLRDCVRSTDTVARLGGDEFALLLTNVSPARADSIVETIRDRIGLGIMSGDRELFVGASIGVAESIADERPDHLLHRADIAMYASKARRDGRHTWHTPDMVDPALDGGAPTELWRAHDGGQFRVFYQPVVTLPDGRITGVEALVRWEHPSRGLVAPDEFIPAAERNGFIVELGAWVLREACRQQARWLQEYGTAAPQTVAVNVSPRQLREPDFVRNLQHTLMETALDPDRLILEITESAAVAGGATDANLQAADRLGVRLSLDDFGTGHSTLALLHSVPVAQIKLDRSFTHSCLLPGRDIATAVIQLARALGLDVVAEGVETRQQAERLHALGYRTAQGYHFYRPMSGSAVTEVVAEQSRSTAVHPTARA